MDSILSSLGKRVPAQSSLKPTMHNVKVYSGIISALNNYGAATNPRTIEAITAKIESYVDSILLNNGISPDSTEWERATIRSAILPLCENDINQTGAIQGEWLQSVSYIASSLKIKSNTNFTASPSLQAKMALTDSITKLAQATEKLDLRSEIVLSKFVNKVFYDSKALHESYNIVDKQDSSILFSNLLSNHTKLMISAFEGSSSVNETYRQYDKNRKLLQKLVPSLTSTVQENNQSPKKAPVFKTPSI